MEQTDDMRLVLTIRWPDESETIPAVELTGTREGLTWLASRLLAVASRADQNYEHLDEDELTPVFQSMGWRLTISRLDALRGAPPGFPKR
jgi:hypothetical protein